ncbi:procathepsin L [Lutzomyia longipalpis]|uniref:procathepsin L n=1 Tax=Lutzomyia longipalpis TaxID=7200 RepID=UPI0024835F35|nr:procathepsin L [Lutzomyia longipalpis]XP_055690432.1 procathepsin L [Lutzomyia longipalpis]
MRVEIFSVIHMLVLSLVAQGNGQDISSWEDFKKTYNRTYRRPFRESRSRRAFSDNARLVSNHNTAFAANQTSFRLALNPLADLSRDEYLVRFVRLTPNKQPEQEVKEHVASFGGLPDLPESIDWREKGFQTPPDNQKSCGSCYAFSIVHSIEGQIFKRTSKLISLSEQQVVDCSGKMGNHGCAGGSLRNTLRYLASCGGLMRQQDYPYTAQEGRCRFVQPLAVVNVSNWAIVPSRSEAALAAVVATVGPVAVSINASPRSFQLYGDGVYDDPQCSSESVNHAMLIVGYTPHYWIIKNWWGERWGEGGYMRLQRHQNLCGVANYAAYAIV